MMLFYVFVSACLTVLPPGHTRTQVQPSHTGLQFDIASLPNSRGVFLLDLSQCHQGDWVHVRVTDVINREVQRVSFPPQLGTRVHIDLRGKPTGMYLLEVVQGPCKQVRRLVHQ